MNDKPITDFDYNPDYEIDFIESMKDFIERIEKARERPVIREFTRVVPLSWAMYHPWYSGWHNDVTRINTDE